MVMEPCQHSTGISEGLEKNCKFPRGFYKKIADFQGGLQENVSEGV
jgi:hypothetical protein